MSLGQTIEVSVSGKKRMGRIIALQNDPDPRTFTHALRVRLDGKGLQTGELATANLPLRQFMDVLTVPVSAVLRDEGRDYVFFIQQGKLQRKQIEIAARYQDQFVVEAGLVVGDSIVARDVAALTDGQAVETDK
jgi:hypothetical protein